MARPAKAIAVSTGCRTNEEKAARLELENRLRGSSDGIRAPDELNDEQKAIFDFIVAELEGSKILGNLDVFVLRECAVSLYWMNEINRQMNALPELAVDRKTLSAKEAHSKLFLRCCNELCMSPQSRAKMAGANIQKAAENPLLALLGEE